MARARKCASNEMAVRTVLVCETQVPFVTGGAESHVRELVKHLRAAGYETDLVSVPFKWYPKKEILGHAAAWRLLDLSESNGRSVDLVIGTKFPSYFARHPNKVVWLIHQYRAAYELCGTEYSDFAHTEHDVELRERLIELDTKMLGECQRRYTNSENTAARLQRFNGLDAEALYHPPPLAEQLHHETYDSYILSVGRLESVKRVDLIIDAMRHADPGIRLIIVGEGTQDLALRKRAALVSDRIDFRGRVTNSELLQLYANARAVVYPPYDEDFGYVTLEAFLAHKPVVTASDSGGPLAFIENNTTGIVCEPKEEALAAAINNVADESKAKSLGDAGYGRARQITWNGVIEKLVID